MDGERRRLNEGWGESGDVNRVRDMTTVGRERERIGEMKAKKGEMELDGEWQRCKENCRW